MEVCILQPLNCILQQVIVQIQLSAEEGGTGMRSEPPSVAWPGDHLRLCTAISGGWKLQTFLCTPTAVYSLFILRNERPKPTLSC